MSGYTDHKKEELIEIFQYHQLRWLVDQDLGKHENPMESTSVTYKNAGYSLPCVYFYEKFKVVPPRASNQEKPSSGITGAFNSVANAIKGFKVAKTSEQYVEFVNEAKDTYIEAMKSLSDESKDKYAKQFRSNFLYGINKAMRLGIGLLPKAVEKKFDLFNQILKNDKVTKKFGITDFMNHDSLFVSQEGCHARDVFLKPQDFVDLEVGVIEKMAKDAISAARPTNILSKRLSVTM